MIRNEPDNTKKAIKKTKLESQKYVRNCDLESE